MTLTPSPKDRILQCIFKVVIKNGRIVVAIIQVAMHWGRPLKVGDLVICISAYSPVPAIIIDIKSKKIAASITGDGVDLKDKNGKIPNSEYEASDEFLKITPEILKAIYNMK